MHYINSSCICLYTAGDDVLCKFTLTLRSPQVLRKHKVPFSDPVESELKKTSMVLWAGCKVNFGCNSKSLRPPLLRRGTRSTIHPENLKWWFRVSWDFRMCREPFVLQPHDDNVAENVVNVKCSVMLSVLNIWTALQPTLLSASLSVRHLRRQGLEALEDRLYGRRMNNSSEVDRRDSSCLITSKASGLP